MDSSSCVAELMAEEDLSTQGFGAFQNSLEALSHDDVSPHNHKKQTYLSVFLVDTLLVLLTSQFITVVSLIGTLTTVTAASSILG